MFGLDISTRCCISKHARLARQHEYHDGAFPLQLSLDGGFRGLGTRGERVLRVSRSRCSCGYSWSLQQSLVWGLGPASARSSRCTATETGKLEAKLASAWALEQPL
jgi:hypothetical protein